MATDRRTLRIALTPLPPPEDDDGTGVVGTDTDEVSEDLQGASVRLEQDEYESDVDPCAELLGTGKLSNSGLGYDSTSGTLKVGIRAYITPADLNYSITITHGTLSAGQITESNYADTVTFRMDSAYLPEGISNLQYEWEGPVLNEQGEQVANPGVTVADGEASTSAPVYGNLRVTGTERYVYYIASIPQRSGSDINANDLSSVYAAKVIATWAGGATDLEINAPDPGGDCYSVVTVNDDDEEICYKKVVTVDPCTGEIQSEELQRVPC